MKAPSKGRAGCEELGLTEHRQPGRAGSDGGLDGLALVHSVILQVSPQDLQVVLPRQVVSYHQIAWVTCQRQSTGQEAAAATKPGMRRAEHRPRAPAPHSNSPPWQPARRDKEKEPAKIRKESARFALQVQKISVDGEALTEIPRNHGIIKY